MSAPDYITSNDIKDELGITDSDDDTRFGRLATDGSRWFDAITFQAAGSFALRTATKVYDVMPVVATLEFDRRVKLELRDPLVSITTLKADSDGDRTYDETWAATDYYLYPTDGPPYWDVVTDTLNGDYAGFPAGRQRVQIAGTWGRVDEQALRVARRASLILALRLRNRSKSPEGIIGDAERGFVALNEIDPDVAVAARMLRHERSYFA